MLGAIEVCWNLYPPSSNASIVLFACHILIILAAALKQNVPKTPYLKTKTVHNRKID